MKDTTVKTYEKRCADLAKEFAKFLDTVKLGPANELPLLSARIQAEQGLADFKFKFRQADHVHQLLYGPWAISVATFVLAVVVASVGIFQPRPKEQDTQASLVLKVLVAPPEEGKQLLTFFEDAGLLKLKPAQQAQLEKLLRK